MFNILLLLLCSTAQADDSIMKYGVGIFNSAKESRSEMKQFSFAWQAPVFKGYLVRQYEVGGWLDSRSDIGRKSSGFTSASIGVPIEVGYFYAQALWGAALITTPDEMLGSVFQFKHDMALGIRDEKGNTIGLNYSHMSDAGIKLPNEGRDVMSVRISIPW